MKLVAEIFVRVPNTPVMRNALRRLGELAHDRAPSARSHEEREAWRLLHAQIGIALEPEQLEAAEPLEGS